MSEENVDVFKRGVSAMNAGNVDRLLDVVLPDVVWRDAINALVGGEATIYRGYGGVRPVFRDLFEFFAGIMPTTTTFVTLATSACWDWAGFGCVARSPGRDRISRRCLTEWRHGKAIRVLTYLDHAEALEAADRRSSSLRQRRQTPSLWDRATVGESSD